MDTFTKKLIAGSLIACTLITLILTTVYVYGIISARPSLETNYMPIVISYPDSMYRPFYGENASICTVKFLLEYNGTLAENTHVEIVNATCTSYVPYNITVQVGIPQAIRYELKDTIGNNETMVMDWGGTDILTFYDSYTPILDNPFQHVVNYHLIYPSLQEEIFFPVAGDYSPIILIAPKNDPYNVTLYRFDQIKIHVATETEVEDLNVNKINLGITVALFAFSWIGEFVLIYELMDKVLQNNDGQIVININIVPDTNKPIPVSNTDQEYTLDVEKNSKENKDKSTKNKPSKSNTSPK